MEGIAKAKVAGVCDVSRIKTLKQQGIGPSAIAKTLGIGRASV